MRLTAQSTLGRAPSLAPSVAPLNTNRYISAMNLLCSISFMSPTRDWIDLIPVVSGLLLVGVGVWGVWMAKETLGAIKKQLTEIQNASKQTDEIIKQAQKQAHSTMEAAQAAKQSADAAALNAQAIINSERPWVFIHAVKPDNSPGRTVARFVATNRGRTPAEIAVIRTSFAFGNPDALPDFPSYPLSNLEWTHKKYLATNDTAEVFNFDCGAIISDEQWKKMLKEKKVVIFYGQIVYRNLITRAEHETRFCYWLTMSMEANLVVGGPPEWNKHT